MYIEFLKEETGCSLKEVKICKNGVEKTGICIDEGKTINPVVYPPEGLSKEQTLEWFKKSLEYINSKEEETKRIYEKLKAFSKSEILKRLRIGLQKDQNCENLVKREVLQMQGVIQYLYLLVDECEESRVRITDGSGMRSVLEKHSISEEAAWHSAMENLSKEVVIKSLGEILHDSMLDKTGLMYCVTVQSRMNGAAAILCEETLKKLEEIFGKNFVVLPSSVHEVLITSVPEDGNMESLTELVQAVNNSQVEVEEQLSDRAYLFEE